MKKEDANEYTKQAELIEQKDAVTPEQIQTIVAENLRLMFGGLQNNPVEDNTKKADELKKEINKKLTGKDAISVAFPECSDVMLSLIDSSKTDEISEFFKGYFTFSKHSIIPDNVDLKGILDKGFENCPAQGTIKNNFPPAWCLPPTCVTLNGERRKFVYEKDGVKKDRLMRRLFVADLVWLFYFDRMGIFKILGAILDDYAIKGKLPISNGSVNVPTLENKDDLITIVLEAMTRKTKMGLSSTVRDRNISYRRGLGWILEEGRKLNLDTVVNTGFTNLFHKFVQIALEYYKDKRLAVAITGINSSAGKTSVATLTSIGDMIDLLKRTFDLFSYGRNYSNTLSGIVWVVAGMALIREMRSTLGIPSEYNKPDQFIPAAYDVLIAKTSIASSETNRYDVHRDCAENARDILLDLEILEAKISKPDLEAWLDIIEEKIEGYRTAYRSLTGVDLGAGGTPVIEQQV